MKLSETLYELSYACFTACASLFFGYLQSRFGNEIVLSLTSAWIDVCSKKEVRVSFSLSTAQTMIRN